MTIPTLVHKQRMVVLKTQFKKTYADLNRAAKRFYAEHEMSVSEYDIYINPVPTTNSNPLIEEFMKMYVGSKDEGQWYYYDPKYKIKSKGLSGTLVNRYCDASHVYTDRHGRLYAFDDSLTSPGYGRRYENGPKVCVDINGFDKPNIWGYDRFVLLFTINGSVIPYTGKQPNGLDHNLIKEEEIAKFCDKTGEDSSFTCAYFALRDKSPEGNGHYWGDFIK